MKKLTLALVGIVCGTYVYGAEPQPQSEAALTQEDAQIVSKAFGNAKNIEELITRLDLSQEEQSWISKHKKQLIASPIFLAALYCILRLPVFDLIDEETGKPVKGSSGHINRSGRQYSHEESFIRTDLVHILFRERSKRTAIVLALIAASALIYDLTRGKDAKSRQLLSKCIQLSNSLFTQDNAKRIQKVTIATTGTAAGLYIAAQLLSLMAYPSDPQCGCAVDAQGKPVLLVGFRKACDTLGMQAQRSQTPLAIITILSLITGIALYEYSRGKDATTIRLWNKFFGTKEAPATQVVAQASKEVEAQPHNVAAPVAA